MISVSPRRLVRFRGLAFTLVVMTALFASAASRAWAQADAPVVVVAEGESFTSNDGDGWRPVHQDRSYASHAHGGMWASHGTLLSAPADLIGDVATRVITIPQTGAYRVWSKYQSPPYFHFAHRLEIHQNGQLVFAHDYGKLSSPRLYSFSGQPYGSGPVRQVWHPRGMEHDAAEAPREMASLAEGPAELRLIALENPHPAGDRFIDFIVLTTEPGDTYAHTGRSGRPRSPFMWEARDATPIYMRFRNVSEIPVRASLSTHFGHITAHYGAKLDILPAAMTPPGQWSPWFDLSRTIYLFTDEGLAVTLVGDVTGEDGQTRLTPAQGVPTFPVEVALDTEGRVMLGRLEMPQGATIHFPVDIAFNRDKTLELAETIAARLAEQARTQWRRSSPEKPGYIAFFGAFGGGRADWALPLKDALGYNTQLPPPYRTLDVDGYHQHLRSPDQILALAKSLEDGRERFRVASFGGELSLGRIDFNDPRHVEPFRAWLRANRVTTADLGGFPVSNATLTGNRAMQWHAERFAIDKQFETYRRMTRLAEEAIGPQVLVGANFSPRHGVPFYGRDPQWTEPFRHDVMSMFWSEDHVFSNAEPPQILSFLFARIHSAVKYHHHPIHMYLMPLAPGQTPGMFRRNMVYAIGAGTKHVDHFWVAPQSHYSENSVSWEYPDMFRVIFESIHDTAAVEPWLKQAQRRKARVAVITSGATDFNEDRKRINPMVDPFLAVSELRGRPVQITSRKDQQAIYLALVHDQHAVDLLTEEDIIEGRLEGYDVAHFAGEWINRRAIPPLADWVEAGGTLYASTGLGWRNELDQPESGLLNLLGLSAASPPTINLLYPRPLLELCLAEPIDAITMADQRVGAIGLKQTLTPTGPTRVLGRWSTGEAAVTVRELGQGRAFAVGAAPGLTYLRTGLRPVPWAKGGEHNLYHPSGFDPAARSLVRLAIDAVEPPRQAWTSNAYVEPLVLDSPQGTLVTLVNWTNEAELEGLRVSVRLEAAPQRVRSVTLGEELAFDFADGVVTFSLPLREADFVTIE